MEHGTRKRNQRVKVKDRVVLKDNGYTPVGYELRVAEVIEVINETVIKIKIGAEIFKVFTEDVFNMKLSFGIKNGYPLDHYELEIDRKFNNYSLHSIYCRVWANGDSVEGNTIKQKAKTRRRTINGVAKVGKVNINISSFAYNY